MAGVRVPLMRMPVCVLRMVVFVLLAAVALLRLAACVAVSVAMRMLVAGALLVRRAHLGVLMRVVDTLRLALLATLFLLLLRPVNPASTACPGKRLSGGGPSAPGCLLQKGS